ncbi:type VI secretion system protein [Dyella sp.]|uniref:type VI secretion system protein n=1 Tax=Dyella sp. TaxID=1869338 RepID=UPI002ED25248
MSLKDKPWFRPALFVGGGVVLLALIVFVAPAIVPVVPPRFWQLLGLCLAALAVLWWFTRGARSYSRAGRAMKRIGDLGPGNPDDEREPLARMSAAIQEAKRAIQRSPEMAGGRNPLYRVPWLLFLGDNDAHVRSLLQAASAVSPFPAPAAADADALWRWWFFKSMIAIETSPRLVCDANARTERGLWYQALMQLASEREQLPLNGVVVCVGARSLLDASDALKDVGMRLRRLVDESMEHLQVNLPVYVLVTGLEDLPGYATFRGALPAEAFSQALGWRLPENETVSAGTSARFEDLFAPVAERLHALRMTALTAQHHPEGRRGVFEFVRSIQRMQTGLRQVIGLLLEDNPFQRTPRWRGLFFAAGADTHAPAGGFVADLFTRFLPVDQPLATTSFKGSAGRLGVAALGVAALLGLSIYLTHGLSQARNDDAQLLAQTRAACTGRENAGASGRIAWVAGCGRTIEQLEASADKTQLGFGLRRSDRDIEQLKHEVVADFSSLILAPYDQMIDEDIGNGRAGLEHVLALTQRLRVLDRCRHSGSDCLDSEAPHNVVFDSQSRLFAPFFTADADTRRDRDNAQALFSTYLGYLRWQKSAVLDDEEHRLRGQLRRLLAVYSPRPQDIETWADARAAGPRLQDYWLPTGQLVGVDAGSLPTISAAYTADTWQGVVEPMSKTIGNALAEKKSLADGFRHAYFSAYFHAWAQFQSRFFDGVKLWKGRGNELVARAAGDENPYRFFFESEKRQLLSLPLQLPLSMRWRQAWDATQAAGWGGWRPFGVFLWHTVAGWFSKSGEPAPTWLLAQFDTQRQVLAKQRALFANGYLRLQAQGGEQNLYQIMADLYRAKGAPTQSPANEYATLLQSVDRPEDKFAAQFKGDDLAAWSVVQGPSRLLLYLTVQRAASYVQQRWNEGVVAPLKTMPPEQQMAALYGAQGKLNAFVNDWLAPFVSEKERAPIRVGAVALPLSAGFQAMLAAQSQTQPTSNADQPFLAGTFMFSGPSQLGSLIEGNTGTVVQIDCKDRNYSTTTKAASLAESKLPLYWSAAGCLQATVRISMETPPPSEAALVPAGSASAANAKPPVAAEPLVVTKLYSGQDGFLQLLKDFSTGSHAFTLDDFRDSYTPLQWADIGGRLRDVGFAQAQVFLTIDLSDAMKQYLNARQTPVALPASIIE